MGVEITAIHDDRFLGELLQALLDSLIGKVFKPESLAKTVREVLQSTSESGKTFGSEIESGALGAAAYRKVRFLHCADDDSVLNWGRAFISEWYPAHIEKRGVTFRLTYAKNIDLRMASFQQWMMHQPSIPDGTQIHLDLPFQTTELPDPDASVKKVAPVSPRRRGDNQSNCRKSE